MKKTMYNTPTTKVVRIKLNNLIAASNETLQVVGGTETVTDTEDLLSRRSKSIWDDEE